MTVNIGGSGADRWTGDGDTGIGGIMKLGSTDCQHEDFRNGINLNGADRTVYVADNPNSANDYAVISGFHRQRLAA